MADSDALRNLAIEMRNAAYTYNDMTREYILNWATRIDAACNVKTDSKHNVAETREVKPNLTLLSDVTKRDA